MSALPRDVKVDEREASDLLVTCGYRNLLWLTDWNGRVGGDRKFCSFRNSRWPSIGEQILFDIVYLVASYDIASKLHSLVLFALLCISWS